MAQQHRKMTTQEHSDTKIQTAVAQVILILPKGGGGGSTDRTGRTQMVSQIRQCKGVLIICVAFTVDVLLSGCCEHATLVPREVAHECQVQPNSDVYIVPLQWTDVG